MVALPAVIVAAAGVGFTNTSVEADAPDEHPSKICSTVYDPVVVTVMDCVVSPVDHCIFEPLATIVLNPHPLITLNSGAFGILIGLASIEAGGLVQPVIVCVTV